MGLHVFFHRFFFGVVEAEVECGVAAAHFVGQIKGFGVEAAGLQHEHFHAQALLRQQVGNQHILHRQAAGQLHAAVAAVDFQQAAAQRGGFFR